MAQSASLDKKSDQPTQPLQVDLPPGTGRSSVSGVWLVPATVVAAVGGGELLRAYVLLEQAARTTFAIVALLLVVIVCELVFVLPHLLNRRDGRGRG